MTKAYDFTALFPFNYTEMAGGQNDSKLRSIVYPNGRILDYAYSAGQVPLTGITYSGTTATASTVIASGLSAGNRRGFK